MLLWVCVALGSVVLILLVGYFSGAFAAAMRVNAQAALHERHWAKAERWLAAASRIDANDPATLFLQARLQRKLGRSEQMIDRLQDAAAAGFDPARVEREAWLAAAERGELKAVESRLPELLIAGEEVDEVSEAFVRGYLQTYRIDEALNLLNLWEADFPNDPRAPFLRGRILEHLGQSDDAVQQYRDALSIDPEYGPAHFSLAQALVTQRQVEQALPHFDAASETLYDEQPALVGKADALLQLQRYDEARHALEQVDLTDHDRAEVAWRLVGEPWHSAGSKWSVAMGQLELAAEHWEEAERHFRAALKRNPQDRLSRYHLGTALREQGELEEAAEQMRQYQIAQQALASCDRYLDDLKRDPQDVEARYHFGKVMLEHVSASQGLVWLQSVLSYDPDHVPTHQALADFYAKQAKTDPSLADKAEHHRRLAERAAKAQTVDKTAGPGDSD